MEERSSFVMLSLVAIVAVVALVVLVSRPIIPDQISQNIPVQSQDIVPEQSDSEFYTDLEDYDETETSDLAGMATGASYKCGYENKKTKTLRYTAVATGTSPSDGQHACDRGSDAVEQQGLDELNGLFSCSTCKKGEAGCEKFANIGTRSDSQVGSYSRQKQNDGTVSIVFKCTRKVEFRFGCRKCARSDAIASFLTTGGSLS